MKKTATYIFAAVVLSIGLGGKIEDIKVARGTSKGELLH